MTFILATCRYAFATGGILRQDTAVVNKSSPPTLGRQVTSKALKAYFRTESADKPYAFYESQVRTIKQ